MGVFQIKIKIRQKILILFQKGFLVIKSIFKMFLKYLFRGYKNNYTQSNCLNYLKGFMSSMYL